MTLGTRRIVPPRAELTLADTSSTVSSVTGLLFFGVGTEASATES